MAPSECPAAPLAVPPLGAHEEEIVFVGWLVENGQYVMAGERVAELLVQGVLVQLASPVSGRLQHGSLRTDAIVQVGQTLAEIVPDSDESPG